MKVTKTDEKGGTISKNQTPCASTGHVLVEGKLPHARSMHVNFVTSKVFEENAGQHPADCASLPAPAGFNTLAFGPESGAVRSFGHKVAALHVLMAHLPQRRRKTRDQGLTGENRRKKGKKRRVFVSLVLNFRPEHFSLTQISSTKYKLAPQTKTAWINY